MGHDVFRLSRNANGWVTTRWTPEFGNTTYGYDLVGNLTNVANGAVSNGYAYDGLNQLTNVVDGLGTTKFTYSGGGQLATEDGPWVSDTVSYSYSEGQRTALTFGTWGQSYGYDASGRMTNLTSGAGTFGYTYNSGVSALITRLTLPNTGYITNHYDTLARLDYSGLGNHWGQILDAYGYTYDPGSQRTNIARDYGLTTSSVTAGYDNIGQLTSWSGKEAGGALRWNEQLTYTYDAANNLRTRAQNYFVANQTFNVNAINEVTNVARIGIQTITGYTPSPATNVTVGSNTMTNQAERYGDFTFASTNHLTDINNNTFTITAKNKYGVGTTNTWTQDMPLSIGLQYDSNGNLTNDGVKVYSYDAWNQLTTNFVAGAWKTEFVYDGLGRKRIQRDYTWSGGAWSSPTETRYVYDGMLAVQERDASNNPLVTYTRGLDLSGSLQGAGGIGGLLARTDSSTTYYHADGAGNITSLMNVHGDIVARYLYDPFGNLTAKWGSLADANHYRFSSKEIQPLSGLYYYGFRFYEPNLQRWINQDPIGEAGGINLYGFVGNNPEGAVDSWGLLDRSDVFFAGEPFGPAQAAQSLGNTLASGMVTIVNEIGNLGSLAYAFFTDEPSERNPFDPNNPFGFGKPSIVPLQPRFDPNNINDVMRPPPQFPPEPSTSQLMLLGLTMIAPELIPTPCSKTALAGETAAEGGGQQIFRVINDAEKTSIQNSGKFEFLPNGSTPTGEPGKFFWSSMAEAKQFQQYWYRSGENSSIVSTTLGPNATPTLFPYTDGIGTAIWAPMTDLNAPILFH